MCIRDRDNTTTNGIYKIECQSCNKCYIGQSKKQLKKRYFEHLNAYKKPEIYKSNLVTHAINTRHEFPDITNVTLINRATNTKMDKRSNRTMNTSNNNDIKNGDVIENGVSKSDTVDNRCV